MKLQAALCQVLAVCALSAAVESVAGEGASGVHAVCGLSIALTLLRAATQILG